MPDVMKTVGRYEILRELGRGGMALVYLARQTDLDRFVALKELGAFHASDASFAQRFLRESRVAGSLSHPNIVTVHDYFEHDGTPYIAMEYVERGSLRPYVGKMTLAQMGGVLEGLLAGLTNAEQNGIVHRDLKPENLMVTSDGRVKIADFGIAKATTKMQTGAFLTATGTTVGTPTYMAPEQAMAQDIGPWTDLYSVGCMAFELFTGKVPFHDSDAPMAILLRHVNEPIAPVKSIDPEIDQGVSDWIEALLVKDPKQRTQSAGEAWDDFEEIIIGLLGPRWRRSARLTERQEERDTPSPLTPAPFEGTTTTPASEEFQSFAWGQPPAETGAAPAASPGPYTPPPQDLPSEPMVEEPAPAAPPAPEPVAEAPPAAPEAAAPVAPPEAPAEPEPAESDQIDSGFVTFGAPAPAPPTDALIPPEAPPAEPPAAAPPVPEPEPEPEPEAAVVEPEAPPAPPPTPEPEPEPAAEETGFETFVAPQPSRPPEMEPGTDSLEPLREKPAPEPVAEPEPEPEPEPIPEPVAEPEPYTPPPPPPPPPVAPAPEPEPVTTPTPEPVAAAAPTEQADLGATVMPEALRKPTEEAPPKPKKERKPKERKPKEAKPPKPPKPPKPVAAPKPAREPGAPSKAFPIALGAGALLAVILGFVLGGSGGGGEEGGGGGALTQEAASPSAQVNVPTNFAALETAPDVPGLSIKEPAAYAPQGRDGGTAVLVGTVEGDADNSTLLAAPFLQALGEVPQKGAVEIGDDGLQAYRYDNLEPQGFDRRVTVFAAPTSGGVATVACLAPPAEAESFSATCDQIANTLQISSGEPVPVGPSPTYAGDVSKVIEGLNAADKSGQAKLKAAKTPQAQGAAARSLAGAYDKAAKGLQGLELSPADRGVNGLLVEGLQNTSAAYRKAAAAAAKGDKAAYRKASADVRKGRLEVGVALEGLKKAGYDVAT